MICVWWGIIIFLKTNEFLLISGVFELTSFFCIVYSIPPLNKINMKFLTKKDSIKNHFLKEGLLWQLTF